MKTVRIEWAQIEVDVTAAKRYVVVGYNGKSSMDSGATRHVLTQHDTHEEAVASYRYYFHGIGSDEPSFPRWVHVWDLSSELLK